MMNAPTIDPGLLERVASLKVRAKRVADGFAGLHRSPKHGSSGIFAEHRMYQPGDDLRHLDWRAYARTGRHQLKRFEQEAPLTATLFLDHSASMNFAGAPSMNTNTNTNAHTPTTKHQYAAVLLGALAYLLLRQGDTTHAVIGDETGLHRAPPRSHTSHLDTLFRAWVATQPSGTTHLAPWLTRLAQHTRRRGWVAIASDLLDPSVDALASLSRLTARGHRVVVFHVLDPYEIDFPYDAPARFVGLESHATIQASPNDLRDAYLKRITQFMRQCQQQCVHAGARYVLARTDQPPEHTLAQALNTERGGLC